MKERARVYLGLVHWPILDRAGSVVATNVTNFDIHDIARTCRVYGVEKYFIVNKMREQLMYVHRVLDHWRVGNGAKYNPMRQTALSMVHTAENIQLALKSIEDEGRPAPLVIATAARDLAHKQLYSFRDLRGEVETHGRDLFLVFGTGFGLHQDVLDQCHGLLEPIRGATTEDYRHLSVRAAVSICLDRLFGRW